MDIIRGNGPWYEKEDSMENQIDMLCYSDSVIRMNLLLPKNKTYT